MVKTEDGVNCPVKKIEGGEIIGLVAEAPAPEVKEDSAPQKKTRKKTADISK